MSDYITDFILNTPPQQLKMATDFDIEVDDHGVCYLVALIYCLDEESPQHEVRVKLDGVIDSVKECLIDANDYTQIYTIAHELSRQAERLREVAGNMEDSVSAVEDLFNVSND
tara:strand:+ start:192 stop:530 length:339 start_codon:yes stop_codon:yes gene_type:complete